MAAPLQVSEADLSYLGRWSPTTTKSYVRTATEVVMRAQETVATRLRRDFDRAGAAIVGEQSAFLEMRRELIKRRFAGDDIADQMDAFQAWTAQLADAPVSADPCMPLGGLEVPGTAEDDEDGDATPAEEEEPCEVSAEAPPTPPAEPASSQAAAPVLPVAPSPEDPPVSGFVVSLSKSDWRRLHRIGGCARHPGVHYLRFEWLGDAKPAPEAYDDFCRQCWRTGGPDEGSDNDESDTEIEDIEKPLLVEDPEELPAEAAGVAF